MRYAAPSEWQCFLVALAEARRKFIDTINKTSDSDGNSSRNRAGLFFEWPCGSLPFTIRSVSQSVSQLVCNPKETAECRRSSVQID